MGFVKRVVGNSAEPVSIDGLDFGRSFYSIGGGSISRYVKGLVGIFGVVVVVRAKNLILRVQVKVDPAKDGTVANQMVDRGSVVLLEVRLHEIQECNALAVGTGADQCIGSGSTVERQTGR